MTSIDLRIKYKSETGYSPTYGKDIWGHTYQGGLTHQYAEWLEGHLSKQVNTRKRDYYLKGTGMHGTYYDKNRIMRYTKHYKEWLEERACQAYTVLEKLKK